MAKLPIFFLSDTNCTSGMTAKGNCIDRITWLRINNLAVPLSP